MLRWVPLIITTSLLLVACGDGADPPVRAAVAGPVGAPQGPVPKLGLKGADLPRGATLTGTPARALATVGDVVYAAGISWVAPLRGSAVTLQGGAFARALGLNGQVSDAVPDGRGGVYLAGDFDRAAGQRRRGLVHLFGTGELDRQFDPRLTGFVASLLLDGGILYAGGSPNGLRPGTRGVVAVNAGTGKPIAGFDADVAPGITELALRDGMLYVGGTEPGLRGRPERAEAAAVGAPLVALDARSGVREPGFSPPADGTSSVTALGVFNAKLWVGGSGSGPALALLDLATGAAAEEQPATRGAVRELVRDGERVIAVGDLRGRGGERELAQALDPSTGARRSGFSVRAPRGGGTQRPAALTVVVRGRELWLGGLRRTGRAPADGTAPREGFVSVHDLATGAPRATRTPVPDGPVNALARAGKGLVVAGDFAALDVRRQDLAAFSATSGAYAPGVPLPPTRAARALASAGGRLWVLDGRELLIVEPATGGVRKRIALPVRVGLELTVAGGRVFVSGAGLGEDVLAFDGRTGARVPFRVPLQSADARPPVLLGDGGTLWVGGSFDREGVGAPTTLSVLRLDARTGTLDEGFDPRVNGPVRGLALDDDRLFLAGRFTRAGELRRRNLAAVDAESGEAIAAFEPGAARTDGEVRLERLDSRLLVTASGARPSAYALEDGGPAPLGLRGTSRVVATAPDSSGDGQVVAGTFRSYSTLGPAPRRGVILPPRG